MKTLNCELALLNTWFQKNNLSLNTTKTVSIFLSSRKKMAMNSQNLIIGANPVTNIKSHKFLGLVLDENLRWNAHGEELSDRLSSACFLLRQIRKLISVKHTKTIYFAYFESILRYGIPFWSQCTAVLRQHIFSLQKRAIRILINLNRSESCRGHFRDLKVLTLPSLYIFECIKLILKNIGKLKTQNEIHSHFTRGRHNLVLPCPSLELFKRDPNYVGMVCYNKLPENLKIICRNGKIAQFKSKLKNYLNERELYNINEL